MRNWEKKNGTNNTKERLYVLRQANLTTMKNCGFDNPSL